jgi:enediyne biosynthesis protein E4
MGRGSVCLLSSLFRAAAIGLALSWLGASSASLAESPIRFGDATGPSGISFTHTDGSSGRRYLVEAMSAGLATFDYDGDGLIDIYFVNGAPLPGMKWSGPPPKGALYRNQGRFRFADVTEKAGVGHTGFGLGIAAGDYDNDGWQDIYLSNFGPNVLYRNRGDGSFEDVTARAGVSRGNKVGAGVAFLDADGDGNLDLFAANYIRFSFEAHKLHRFKGVPIYPGPLDYSGESGNLFRNRGDGTFADVSRESRIAAHAGTGMGVTCADCDNDGRTDIFVANDVMQNFLFHNEGGGKFEECGVTAGVAFDPMGVPHGSMGVDAGDYDHDGRLDLVVTAYQREFTTLYRNLGDGFFGDVTASTGAGAGSFNHVKWGVGLVDFDNDGHRDLFIACGHVDDNVELRDDTASYRAHSVVLRNTGNGHFVDVSEASGLSAIPKRSSRGVAFDDLDNDGRIDVVILNSRQAPTILRNESPPGNHWLQVQLRGVRTNRDGVGARVRVVAGDLVQIDEVHSGRGYQSHWGSRLHFGLGKHDRVDRVEVRWIGGGVDLFENVGVDRLVTLTEGNAASPSRDRAFSP